MACTPFGLSLLTFFSFVSCTESERIIEDIRVAGEHQAAPSSEKQDSFSTNTRRHEAIAAMLAWRSWCESARLNALSTSTIPLPSADLRANSSTTPKPQPPPPGRSVMDTRQRGPAADLCNVTSAVDSAHDDGFRSPTIGQFCTAGGITAAHNQESGDGLVRTSDILWVGWVAHIFGDTFDPLGLQSLPEMMLNSGRPIVLLNRSQAARLTPARTIVADLSEDVSVVQGLCIIQGSENGIPVVVTAWIDWSKGGAPVRVQVRNALLNNPLYEWMIVDWQKNREQWLPRRVELWWFVEDWGSDQSKVDRFFAELPVPSENEPHTERIGQRRRDDHAAALRSVFGTDTLPHKEGYHQQTDVYFPRLRDRHKRLSGATQFGYPPGAHIFNDLTGESITVGPEGLPARKLLGARANPPTTPTTPLTGSTGSKGSDSARAPSNVADQTPASTKNASPAADSPSGESNRSSTAPGTTPARKP